MKKPLLVTINRGIVCGYKLPEGVEIIVVDFDLAKHQGYESTAKRWLKRVANGADPQTTSEELNWHDWEKA